MKRDGARNGRRPWILMLGGLSASLGHLLGCGLMIGIESIGVSGGAGGAGVTSTGAGGDAGDGASSSGSGPASSGAGGGCSAAAMACAQCAACGDVIDVDIDAYGALPSFHGKTAGASSSDVKLGTGCTQAGGPERIYAVHVGLDGFLTASLTRPTTTFDSVLYARRGPDCCTTSATYLCADSSDGMPGGLLGGEVISFRAAKDDIWYIIVDGVDAAHGAGDYELGLSYAPGVKCSDGPIELPIELGSKMIVLGNAQGLGAAGDTCGQCGPNLCAGLGSETIYRISAPPSVKTLQIGLDPITTHFDSVLYARSVCSMPSTQLICQDLQGAGSDSGEKIKLNNTGVPLYVFVDTGPTPAPSYDYTMIVTPGL